MTTAMTAEQYIDSVLDMMPPATPLRASIAMELRAHIAERVADGHPLDEVLRQLGDPAKLAESYLSADQLVAASFGERAAAKMIDALVVLAIVTPLSALASSLMGGPPTFPMMFAFLAFGGSMLLCVYTVIAEYRSAQTLGKRSRGIHVVRESGRRIGLGQAVVRQLGILLSMYWIDILFALFTEKRQRAFELLSKTRVVLASPREVQ